MPSIQLINEINFTTPSLITTNFQCSIEIEPIALLTSLNKYMRPLNTYNLTYSGINTDDNLHVFHIETNNPKDLIYIGMWISTYISTLDL